MCEISPKIQCLRCLTYWTKGIVYCTCGTCLRPPDKTRKLNRDRLDALSIPNYVIKKGPSHGARHGNTEGQRIYHAAHTAAKKAKKKEYDSIIGMIFKIVQFTESHRSRLDGTKNSAHATTQDHSYVAATEERKRRENSWVLVLNSQGKHGPMNQREDHAEAKRIKE